MIFARLASFSFFVVILMVLVFILSWSAFTKLFRKRVKIRVRVEIRVRVTLKVKVRLRVGLSANV